MEEENESELIAEKNIIMKQDRHTSKRALNFNAVKFKLCYLDSDSMIRYEVIYKNLLRDLRKFFTQHFHASVIWPKSRDHLIYEKVFTAYIVELFGKDKLARLEVTESEMAFCLGALIKPKHMLQHPSPHEKSLSVAEIYFFLYKFSLQRLQRFLDMKPMSALLGFYL
jgi:hypothetical protein